MFTSFLHPSDGAISVPGTPHMITWKRLSGECGCRKNVLVIDATGNMIHVPMKISTSTRP